MDQNLLAVVLNSACGDMLKAQVLRSVMPDCFGQLDLTRIKLPPGTAERAFQEAASSRTMRSLEPIAPVMERPAERLSAAPPPQPKPNGVQSETIPLIPLKPVPAMRFEDRETKPTASIQPSVPPNSDATISEPVLARIEPGPQWLTFAEAAKVRGCSEANISILAGKKGWRKERDATNPRRFLVARSDVEAA